MLSPIVKAMFWGLDYGKRGARYARERGIMAIRALLQWGSKSQQKTDVLAWTRPLVRDSPMKTIT